MNNNITNASFFIPSGHTVLLYEDESEVIKIIASFIRKRLAKNEKVMYITGDANTQMIIDALKNMGMYDQYINIGQLIILDKESIYSRLGTFNPQKMIDLIVSEVKNAVSDGYKGFSISSEISWVLNYENGIDKSIEYEWKLNEKVFDQYPVSAICRYNINKFSDKMISQIIELHPYLIWKEKIHENPFYIPVEGYKNQEIDKYRVKAWLKNIDKFTNTKSDFYKKIKQKQEKIIDFRVEITKEIIVSLTQLLAIHDPYTKNHSNNVAEIAQVMARELQLSEKTVQEAYYAGLLHDIGKILISNDVLHKQHALTQNEYEIIKQHTCWGYQTLSKSKELTKIATYILYHHERWDGRGYPKGLSKTEIPLISRVLAVADAYDAMTSDRPYRKALSIEVAIQEIEKNAGSQFDPQLVKVFLGIMSKINYV